MNIGRQEVWLEFDGVNDYVQARDASVFDVTTGDFDMEVEYRSTKVLTSVNNRLLDKRGTGLANAAASYQLSAWSNNNSFGNVGVTATDGTAIGYSGSALSTVPYPTDGQWHKVRLTWENATGKLRLYVDGDLKQELTNSGMIGKSITTSRIFTVGASANSDGQFFEGDIRSFRFGTETFPLNEGTGTTVTGSEGTVLDIYGATWKKSPVLYAGSEEVKSVYLGNKQVYPAKPTISMVWDTSLGDGVNTVELPLLETGTYDFKVYHQGEQLKHVTSDADYVITFPGDPGIKQIDLVGSIQGFNFFYGVGTTGSKVISVNIFDNDLFEIGNYQMAFRGCPNFKYLSGLEKVNSSDLSYFLHTCYSFVGDVSNLDVSSVTTFQGTFYRAYEFNQDISNWDVSSGIQFSSMFNGATIFNQDISGWDVSNATSMNTMFSHQSARPGNFNQDLSSWCVQNIPSKPSGFDKDCPSWVLPQPVWGTCP